MSVEAYNYVTKLKVGNITAKFVLGRLADRADERFSCYPSVGLLAAEAEKSERTVQRSIEFLVELRLLSDKPAFRSDGSQTSNRYFLHGPWDGYAGTGTPFPEIVTPKEVRAGLWAQAPAEAEFRPGSAASVALAADAEALKASEAAADAAAARAEATKEAQRERGRRAAAAKSHGPKNDPSDVPAGEEGATCMSPPPPTCMSPPGASPMSPLESSSTTHSSDDALSARSAGDGRRPSSTGSSVREAEGGSAASSKTTQPPSSKTPTDRAKTGSSSKTKHAREQLDVARQVAAAYPEELGVRLVPVLTDAILHALAGDVPGSDRTVGQLGARIQQRWNHHGYAAAFYAGKLTTPIGAAVEMVRPLKTTDRYGCGNPRCEVGTDVDTGAPCLICPERLADRRRARRKDGDTVPGQRAEPPGRLQWECGSATCRKAVRGPRTASGLCPGCEAELERAAAHLQPERPAGSALAPAAPSGVPSETGVDEETARLRAMYARQYGSPEQVEAYCANAPF